MNREAEFLSAVQTGGLAQVKDFLKQDRTLAAAKNAAGVSAVMLALYYRQKEVVSVLLAAGLDLDVFEASASGQTDRVSSLLKNDPGLVNAFTSDGFAPLGLAAYFGQQAVVELLLASGATANQAAKNAMKVTPLHSAASSRQTEIARLLIDHGADVNARQQGDVTPLHAAAANGDMELARLLLSRGADLNAKMQDGTIALNLAVKNNRAEMADYLRRHGPDH